MTEPDLLLWKEAQAGDIEAFELLFRKYYAALCIYAGKFLNDPDSARDVVQDLFVRLWESRDHLNITTSFQAYIYASVRFNSIRRREQGATPEILPDHFPDMPEDFEDFLEYIELYEKMMKAIESLPEKCRMIFKMSRFGLFKYSEIARNLNLSVKTVEAQISKALRILQKVIQDDLTKK